MGTKCPKCKTDNPDTQKFCGECATQLKPVHAETRTLRTPAKDSTIKTLILGLLRLRMPGRGWLG